MALPPAVATRSTSSDPVQRFQAGSVPKCRLRLSSSQRGLAWPFDEIVVVAHPRLIRILTRQRRLRGTEDTLALSCPALFRAVRLDDLRRPPPQDVAQKIQQHPHANVIGSGEASLDPPTAATGAATRRCRSRARDPALCALAERFPHLDCGAAGRYFLRSAFRDFKQTVMTRWVAHPRPSPMSAPQVAPAKRVDGELASTNAPMTPPAKVGTTMTATKAYVVARNFRRASRRGGTGTGPESSITDPSGRRKVKWMSPSSPSR
jgi:hypothetical protein